MISIFRRQPILSVLSIVLISIICTIVGATLVQAACTTSGSTFTCCIEGYCGTGSSEQSAYDAAWAAYNAGTGSGDGSGSGSGSGSSSGSGSGSSGGKVELANPLGDKDLTGIIQGVVNFIFKIALIVCPLIIIWGGFIYVTSGGNEEKTREGKRIITYAIVGLIIIILANGFVAMIKTILGVK